MKITCDFLPAEYKAYQLDMSVFWLSVAAWVLSLAMWGVVALREANEIKTLAKQVTEQEGQLKSTQEERRRTLYPQDRIKELKGKFEFIRQAMGSKDFPYLRFYLALEGAIPVSPNTGRRKACIKLLKREGNKLMIDGEAADWRDAREFEQKMTASQVGTGDNKVPDFSEVKLLKCSAIPGGLGYVFTVTANFNAES